MTTFLAALVSKHLGYIWLCLIFRKCNVPLSADQRMLFEFSFVLF